MKYVITNSSISIILDDKIIGISSDSINYNCLRKALISGDLALAKSLLDKESLYDNWSDGKIKMEKSKLLIDGEEIPQQLEDRVNFLLANGKDPEPIFNFWKRLKKNPSMRSVEQLWNFLNNLGIPLTEDGCFLAYKGVNKNYTDCYTSSISNLAGEYHKMNRNLVSDDPNEGCHFGFHVGSHEYASSFGTNVVICKVDPEHVVCVPNDSSFQKMRVCEYEVIGYGKDLMSSNISDDPINTKLSISQEKILDDIFNYRHDLDELVKFKSDDLKKFVCHRLKIVGAYKLRKYALITRIHEHSYDEDEDDYDYGYYGRNY